MMSGKVTFNKNNLEDLYETYSKAFNESSPELKFRSINKTIYHKKRDPSSE